MKITSWEEAVYGALIGFMVTASTFLAYQIMFCGCAS